MDLCQAEKYLLEVMKRAMKSCHWLTFFAAQEILKTDFNLDAISDGCGRIGIRRIENNEEL